MREVHDGLAVIVGDDQDRLGSWLRNLQPWWLPIGVEGFVRHSGSVQIPIPGAETSIANVRLNVKSRSSGSQCSGGGGNRTPVPRRHSGCFYVHSRSFVSRVGGRRSTGCHLPQPDCVSLARRQAAHAGQPAGVVGRISRRHPRDGLRVFTQPWHKKSCHIVFRQGFYEAS